MATLNPTPFLCRKGFHNWSGWIFAEHISIPKRETKLATRTIIHHGVEGDLFDRYCKRCGKTEDKIDRSLQVSKEAVAKNVVSPCSGKERVVAKAVSPCGLYRTDQVAVEAQAAAFVTSHPGTSQNLSNETTCNQWQHQDLQLCKGIVSIIAGWYQCYCSG